MEDRARNNVDEQDQNAGEDQKSVDCIFCMRQALF